MVTNCVVSDGSTDAQHVLNEGKAISLSAARQSVEMLFDCMRERWFYYGSITAVRK